MVGPAGPELPGLGRLRSPLVVALDFPNLEEAGRVGRAVAAFSGMLKVGLELFLGEGLRAVAELGQLAPIFLDLKLHDVPRTVARAVQVAAGTGAAALTVHGLGGEEMVKAAVEAAEGRTAILAVTLLTSLGEESLPGLGIGVGVREEVLKLTEVAARAGAAGVVASPLEAPDVKETFPGLLVVCPGLRGWGHGPAGHRRTMGWVQAYARGADLLVVGRPVTEAADPAAAAMGILAELLAVPGSSTGRDEG